MNVCQQYTASYGAPFVVIYATLIIMVKSVQFRGHFEIHNERRYLWVPTQVNFIYVAQNQKSHCLRGLNNLYSNRPSLSFEPVFE